MFFLQDVELIRMKVVHLESLDPTVTLSVRISTLCFVVVLFDLPVVHDTQFLEDFVDLTDSGDETVVQNLVKKKQETVVNSAQDLLKVSRDGSTSG